MLISNGTMQTISGHLRAPHN